MFDYLQSFFYNIFYGAEQLSQTEFILLSALVVLVGGFCLRGFGERI
jgi:hypothetical protein